MPILVLKHVLKAGSFCGPMNIIISHEYDLKAMNVISSINNNSLLLK